MMPARLYPPCRLRLVFRTCCFLAYLALGMFSGIALGQFGDSPTGADLGEPRTTKWKVGVIVEATGGPCRGLFATIPVPTDWPEQKVRVVKEEISPSVKKVRYRVLDNGVKQMLMQIPKLAPGETAQALITYEIDKHDILPPKKTDNFVLPSDIPRDVRKYLSPSPLIEVRHPKIVALAKQLRRPDGSAWQQVETIYDTVREKVEYKNGKLKGAVAALTDGDGDCEELTSLFIAICRANGIPSRTVWVPGHCYPEFYLQDEKGEGYWFPCQAAGTRDFGGIPDQRPILQKGDNFRVPERRDRQRYVAEFLKGNAGRGATQPQVKWVRHVVLDD